jgi:glycosyltransferase involved in cell wall biosynthesis
MKLVGEATMLLFPSQCYEGCPKTIVEAFAKGTPVVASNLGSMSTLVRHGETGLHFVPGDAADLATQVKWLLSHPEALKTMRAHARAEYESTYSAQSNYEILMEAYHDAIEGHKRRHGQQAQRIG